MENELTKIDESKIMIDDLLNKWEELNDKRANCSGNEKGKYGAKIKQLEQQFKNLTGKTPSEYLKESTLDEVSSSGSVAVIDVPTMVSNHDTTYKNKPAFNMNQDEFRKFIKRKEIPKRVMQFVQANKNSKVYLLYDNMPFFLERFFKINESEENDES